MTIEVSKDGNYYYTKLDASSKKVKENPNADDFELLAIEDESLDIDDSQEDYIISFDKIDSWEDGYNAILRIENKSNEIIENWDCIFEYDGKINAIWNATQTSKVGNKYILHNAGWNQDILPGRVVEIGISIQGDPTLMPYNICIEDSELIKSDRDFNVEVKIYDSWLDGCNGNMILTNKSDIAIEDWVLDFECDCDISSIWNAELLKCEGNHYTIKNAGFNSIIEPGQSISIGFIAEGNIEAMNFVLSMYN